MNPARCTGVKQIATLRPSLEMKVRCDPQRNRYGSLVIAHSDIPPKPRPCGPDRVKPAISVRFAKVLARARVYSLRKN